MFRPLALFIGLRYTRAERKNGFISFISLISMIGLTLGVAVLITVLSVMNGFDRELKTRILGMVSQANVSSYEIIPDWQTRRGNCSVYWTTRHADRSWTGGGHYGNRH